MRDMDKAKEQLVDELVELRQRAAEREAAQMKDDFVSTEHLFLALVDASSSIRNLSFLQEGVSVTRLS